MCDSSSASDIELFTSRGSVTVKMKIHLSIWPMGARNQIIRFILALMLFFAGAPAVIPSQRIAQESAKIETTYDPDKDRTTVNLEPLEIVREKGRYHRIELKVSYTYSGRQRQVPETLNFELRTIVKARKLDSDLYVELLVDGERIFLSSDRGAIQNPVPGKQWIGERISLRMPYATFLSVTKARTVAVTMDGAKYFLNVHALKALREFEDSINR